MGLQDDFKAKVSQVRMIIFIANFGIINPQTHQWAVAYKGVPMSPVISCKLLCNSVPCLMVVNVAVSFEPQQKFELSVFFTSHFL